MKESTWEECVETNSFLELLHAVLVSKGYKVKNHICAGYYLRDVMKRNDLFMLFDDCRFKRNSQVYYGKKMHYKIALQTIEKCKKLIKALNSFLKNFL